MSSAHAQSSGHGSENANENEKLGSDGSPGMASGSGIAKLKLGNEQRDMGAYVSVEC